MSFNNMGDLYPLPGNPSDPPTWEDIERLALHYPQVRSAVVLVARGDWTREQALIVIVFSLADSFSRLFQDEVDRLMRKPPQEMRRL